MDNSSNMSPTRTDSEPLSHHDPLEDEMRARVQDSEEDSFSQWYNKELRVSKDEIPIVLMELNDAAYNYLK